MLARCIYVLNFISLFQIALHEYGVFWFFGAVCVCSTIFCVIVVPETKGKTVQEIAAHFGAPAVSQEKKPKDEERKAEAPV